MNMDLFNDLKQVPELWETFVDRKEPFDIDSKCYSSEQTRAMVPSVSEHLIGQGLKVSYPDNKKFAVCLTHDIDELYPPLSHRLASGLWCLKKWNWRGLNEHLFWNRNKVSPYMNFQKIIELEKKYNAKSSFYFMAASRDPVRFRYNIEDIASEMKDILAAGWEVGLHGGYYSYNDIDAIKGEKNRLESVLGKPVIGYRNHYLRFQVPETWELLEKCGFRYDTTYGYSNAIGFRNGMCHPFRPYNTRRREWMELCELPLHVMECALFDSMKPDKAWELIRQLLEETEANSGVLTVLWHNTAFGCPFRERWSALYEKILQYGKEHNAWMTSGEELWRWWTENGG